MKELPRLDPDEQGNAHLQNLIRHLHPDDIAPFVEKLTTQRLRERFHTYRELLLGVHLRQCGVDFRYEQTIGGKTPDWSLHRDEHQLLEVIDVLTLHQRNEKEKDISTTILSNGSWTGWIGIPPDHIYRKLTDKAGQYSELVCKAKVPYVLAVFGEFVASLSPEDIQHVLYVQHDGWFKTSPEVSGVIYFREKNCSFEFKYFPNPTALYSSTVLSG